MNRREGDEHMRILYELSWLWEMLGIALAAAAVCVTCAALICKATKRRPNQKNAGRRRDGGICRCNSGSPSDCADTDAALKIFNPSAAWSTTRRSLPTQSVVGEYIGCQKKLMLSNGESMSFLVCRYGQPLMWSAFYLRFHLNVSFFKEQGECREAACAERQPKCGGKIIARFGVVRRAWGCGRHGSRYGCGSCRRCRRWFRCGRGRWFRCGRGRRFCGWGCRGLRCRRGRRFRRGRCGGLCSRCCRRFHGGGCRRLRGRGQFGRGDGEGVLYALIGQRYGR